MTREVREKIPRGKTDDPCRTLPHDYQSDTFRDEPKCLLALLYHPTFPSRDGIISAIDQLPGSE